MSKTGLVWYKGVCPPSSPPIEVYFPSVTVDVAGLYKVMMRAKRWTFLHKMPQMPLCQAYVERQQALLEVVGTQAPYPLRTDGVD